MSWTEERTATLKRLWEGGSTATEIAKELGDVSRNAVIGKAHRLGLKSRPSPVKAAEKKKAAPKPKPAPKKKAAPAPAPSPAPAPAPVAAKPAAKPASAAPQQPAAPAAQPQATGAPAPTSSSPRIVSVGPGGFLRQGPGDQQPPAPPRRLVPAKPDPSIADKTSLLDLSDKVCRWPMGHPGEPDFHFCGEAVNPGFPYCVEHCGRAYQAQLPRGSRRPPPPLPYGGPRVR